MKKYLIFLLLYPAVIVAEQSVINDYDDARNNYFYSQLHIGTIGESLYCGKSRPLSDDGGKSLEHVMPAD